MESFSSDRLLQRESGGNACVLSAIAERELAVNAIVRHNENFGAHGVMADPLWQNYLSAAHKVEQRKARAGIADPPYAGTDKT